MSGVPAGVDGVIRAIFAYEFDDLATVDATAVDAIRSGEFDDWVQAVADSGLLTASAVRGLELAWRADPELLVDALLDGADEVTRRRFRAPRVAALPAAPGQVSAFG
ncbi:hypothetical protein ACFYVR_20635 [Rhodococcus sp. NPDC003318]|uniref:hypothetical protein n=1 Tax=Rhodococcus sp. NPDC003318 TaxID=3364503 RepID=UPI00367BF6D6